MKLERKTLMAMIWQIGLLACMILWAGWPTYFGKRIEVFVEGRDPRDIFRGNYVTLGYHFNRLNEKNFQHQSGSELLELDRGTPVFVQLKPTQSGTYELVSASLLPYSKGVFLKGEMTHVFRTNTGEETDVEVRMQVNFGLDRYFDQKPNALEFEDNRNRLVAEIAVLSNGRCSVTGLRVHSLDSAP